MEDNQNPTADDNKKEKKHRSDASKGKCNGLGGGVYGLAFIGAAIYFISHAATFWMGVLGFLKALVWPAILVYNLLEFLKL